MRQLTILFSIFTLTVFLFLSIPQSALAQIQAQEEWGYEDQDEVSGIFSRSDTKAASAIITLSDKISENLDIIENINDHIDSTFDTECNECRNGKCNF